MDLSARFLGFTTYGVQWVLWLLMALSVVSIAMMLERLWFFATYHPSPQALAREMRMLLQSGVALGASAGGPLSPGRLAEALDGAVEGARARERLRMERNLAFLGTLGSNAPFIGLFGTVLGIIKAFHDLAGNQAGGPAVVMAGISEALVATAVGLMVAIPAVVAFNYFNRRTRTRMTEVDWMSQLALVDVKGDYAEGATASVNTATPSAAPAIATAQPLRALIPVAGVAGALLLGLGLLLGRAGRPPSTDHGRQAAEGSTTPAPNPLPVPGPAAAPATQDATAKVLPASPASPPVPASNAATPAAATSTAPSPTATTPPPAVSALAGVVVPLGGSAPPAAAILNGQASAPVPSTTPTGTVSPATVSVQPGERTGAKPPTAPASAGIVAKPATAQAPASPVAGSATAKPGAAKWGKRKRWRPAGTAPAAIAGAKPTDAPASAASDAARDADKGPAKEKEKEKEKESPPPVPPADKPTPAPAVP